MKDDFAFPQLFRPAPPKQPELSLKLLIDLSHLCRVESDHTQSMADYTNLRWIQADLERRIRKVRT